MAASGNPAQGPNGAALDAAAHHPKWTWGVKNRIIAVGLALLSVVVLVAAVVIYQHWAGDARDIAQIELAGKPSAIAEIIARHGDGGLYRHALIYDSALIAGYLVAITLACLIGAQLASTSFGRRVFRLAIGAVVAAALLDVAEDVTLWQTLPKPTASDKNWAVAASACAFAKFVVLIPAAIVGVVAVLTTLWRGALRPLAELRSGSKIEALRKQTDPKRPATDSDPQLMRVGDGSKGVQLAAWRANNNLPNGRRAENALGFCVSGGGIRSATFGLGALSSLRTQLRGARYLVSVSGGGYAVGAMQLALHKLHERNVPDTVAAPEDVFLPGSPELDYTRRHGRYLADGAGEWLKAIGVIARGVLVNLLIICVVIVLSGRLLAHAYASFPHSSTSSSFLSQTHFAVQTGIGWAAAVPAALALVLWAFSVLAEPQWTHVRRALLATARGAVVLAIAVTVFGVFIPWLAFLCQKAPAGTLTGTGVPISSAGGLLTAFIALGANPKSRKKALADAEKVVTWYGKTSGKQRNLASRAGILLGGLALVGGLLLLFGVVLAHTGPIRGTSDLPGHYLEWQITLVFGAVLFFFAFVDQVRWSLHPFYRRRLATAFAVRRLRTNGVVKAEAYNYDKELTPLAKRPPSSTEDPEPLNYAARVPGFPQVIFACSAHVSGQQLTPPGRQVLGWTMAEDYVGSPLLGWVKTAGTYNGVSETLRRDLTVEASQAISGAAIASQMGRMQRGYTKLLTLTNVRLGSWLPNPTYLGQLEDQNVAWWQARIPRRRYLGTLAKELVGHFKADAPLVFVTDGGHYDNLGLIELLRHRCAQIVCLDASGDRGDVAATLAQAMQLAYEELGVTIELDDPGQLSSKDSKPATPSDLLDALGARVKRSCVITGRITYPDLGPGLPSRTGKLVLGKAVLTANMPFDVLAYASGDASFPNDSTADQWYDADRFDSYHALGRFVGEQVGQRFGWLMKPGTNPWQPVTSRTPQPPVLVRVGRLFLSDGVARVPYQQ